MYVLSLYQFGVHFSKSKQTTFNTTTLTDVRPDACIKVIQTYMKLDLNLYFYDFVDL